MTKNILDGIIIRLDPEHVERILKDYFKKELNLANHGMDLNLNWSDGLRQGLDIILTEKSGIKDILRKPSSNYQIVDSD